MIYFVSSILNPAFRNVSQKWGYDLVTTCGWLMVTGWHMHTGAMLRAMSIIEFPQNRALYADQFTDQPPVGDEDREPFKARSMQEVFEHFQPKKEGVALTTEEGGSVYEDFDFRSIKDFDDAQLIAQSELLGGEQAKIDAFNAVIRQLEKNKTLRNTLKDAAARGNLATALRALLQELEDNA